MGRRPLSDYPPEVAAKMRAELSKRTIEAWAKREQNGLGTRKNGALQEDVQKRISESVKQRWQEGGYANRINGMLGKTGPPHPNWKEVPCDWGAGSYRDILLQQEDLACRYCGRKEGKIDVHHIDENHDNYLLTNLVWACVPCHLWRFHYENTQIRGPFVTIARKFSFEYAHMLPWHPGKCARLHGHSGHLKICVRGRLDPHGVVMDFSALGDIVKTAVIDTLDHRFLNDFLENPTSEELLIWVWLRLESAGLKGLKRVHFCETDSSTTDVEDVDMIEAFGWSLVSGRWTFVHKPPVEERKL